MQITRIRIITAGLIVASAITFAIGAAVERNSEHHEARPAATATTPDADSGHGGDTDTDGGQAPTSGDNDGDTPGTIEGASTKAAEPSEDIFGINPESTPLVVAAVIGSVILAAALLLFGSPLLAALVGLAMTAFAALDILEVVHQFSASHSGLAVLAIVVAVLHLLAAGGAVTVTRTVAQPRVA